MVSVATKYLYSECLSLVGPGDIQHAACLDQSILSMTGKNQILKLPPNIRYTNVDLRSLRISERERNGSLQFSGFSGPIILHFEMVTTHGSESHQLIVELNDYRICPSSEGPGRITLQRDGAILSGCYGSWFASTKNSIDFQLARLLPRLHAKLIEGGHLEGLASRNDRLTYIPRLSAGELLRGCVYAYEPVEESDQKGGQALVKLSTGNSDLHGLVECLLTEGVSPNLVLKDWLQILHHPMVDDVRRTRLSKRMLEVMIGDTEVQTVEYPTMAVMNLVSDGNPNKIARSSGIGFFVHCTKCESVLIQVLKRGFLGESAEAHQDIAGHGIKMSVGHAHGLGVYTYAFIKKGSEANQREPIDPQQQTSYGHISFVISPYILDRREGSDYRRLPQSASHAQYSGNGNYVIINTTPLYPPNDITTEKLAGASPWAMAIFRDKIPLKYVEEIWIGSMFLPLVGTGTHNRTAEAERVRKLIVDSGLDRYASLIKPTPDSVDPNDYKKGRAYFEWVPHQKCQKVD